MDYLMIMEQYGIPICVATAFGFFIWKQNKYIQDDLTKDLHNKFNRIEGVLIKLIDQQKKMQLEQKGLENSFSAIVTIVAELSGNGLREHLLRVQEKNENKKY